MKNKELRDRIKAICKEKGLSMEDLAGQLGIGKIALSQSLSRDMKISRLYKIADTLGVGVGELFSNSSVVVEIDGSQYSVEKSITIRIKKMEPDNDYSGLFCNLNNEQKKFIIDTFFNDIEQMYKYVIKKYNN